MKQTMAFLAFAAMFSAIPSAQNGSQFRDWKATALADSGTTRPRTSCQALIALSGYEFAISTATVVPKSDAAPEHCRVTGLIQPEVRFEVALPTEWNGRLYMFGNGGYAGEALDQPGRLATTSRALARKFATAQTNTGHDAAVEPLGTFGASPQKVVDYAYRAVHVTLLTAKTIVQAYYGGPARRAYFDGCSTGGRQGLISAQRFPDDFDGILVGAPVLAFTATMIDYAAMQRALDAAPIPIDKVKLIADAVYRKCDAIDGVEDGLLDDPRRCNFTPAVDLPRCAADGDGPACFTTAQLHALDTIYGGVKRGSTEVFPGWPVGSEIAGSVPAAGVGTASGWIPWFLPTPSTPRPVQALFGETFFRNLAFGRPNAAYDWTTFDVDTDFDKIAAARASIDAADPDLSRFKAHGGKIVSYFGWADPALNPLTAVRYYDSVSERMGPSTMDFYRLFMVPGMFHCSGGVGPSTFDAMTPLVEWVERGTPPQSIPAARIVDSKTVRTRPLCPYPQVAKYKGTGSIDEAASFSCAAR